MQNVFYHATNSINPIDDAEATAKEALSSWLSGSSLHTLNPELDRVHLPPIFRVIVVPYSRENNSLLLERASAGSALTAFFKPLTSTSYLVPVAQELIKEKLSLPARLLTATPLFVSLELPKGRTPIPPLSTYWFASAHSADIKLTSTSQVWISVDAIEDVGGLELARFAKKLKQLSIGKGPLEQVGPNAENLQR